MRITLLMVLMTSSVANAEDVPIQSSDLSYLAPELCEITQWNAGLLLTELPEEIKRQHGITCRIEGGGDAGPIPVGFNSHRTPLYQALNKFVEETVLEQWYMDQGELVITFDGRPQRKFYHVEDLLVNWSPAELKYLIYHGTGPWFSKVGIGGTLRFLGPVLIVRSYGNVHREIQQLFTNLRNKKLKSDLFLSTRDLEIQSKLEKLVIQPEPFDLNALAEKLSQLLDADVSIAEFPEDTLSRLTSQTYTMKDGIITAGLDYLGTYVIHGRVIIGTLGCDDLRSIRLYDVSELLKHFTKEQLVKAILEETEGPWKQLETIGGSIRAYSNGAICVTQTTHCHRDVDLFLRELAEVLNNTPN